MEKRKESRPVLRSCMETSCAYPWECAELSGETDEENGSLRLGNWFFHRSGEFSREYAGDIHMVFHRLAFLAHSRDSRSAGTSTWDRVARRQGIPHLLDLGVKKWRLFQQFLDPHIRVHSRGVIAISERPPDRRERLMSQFA